MEESSRQQEKNAKRQNILQVTLPKKDGEGDDIKEKLTKIASDNYRSLSGQVLMILRDYLNRMEEKNIWDE